MIILNQFKQRLADGQIQGPIRQCGIPAAGLSPGASPFINLPHGRFAGSRGKVFTGLGALKQKINPDGGSDLPLQLTDSRHGKKQVQRVVKKIEKPVSFIELFGLRIQCPDRHSVDADLVGEPANAFKCVCQQNPTQTLSLESLVHCEPPEVSHRNRVLGQSPCKFVGKISEGHTTAGERVIADHGIRF